MPRYEVEVQVRLATTIRVHVDADDEDAAADKVYRSRSVLREALEQMDEHSLDYWHTDIEAVREEREVAAAW